MSTPYPRMLSSNGVGAGIESTASVKCRSAGPIKRRSADLFDCGSCGHMRMVIVWGKGHAPY